MSHPPLSALIVDDEPIARQRIRRLLAREPDFRVIGDFGSVLECETLQTQPAPDLLLLDVRMPERNGFELLSSFESRGVHPFVIFVTAYSEYAVEAFGGEAVDYLLKPFDDDRFAKAIARARALLGRERNAGEESLGAREDADPQLPPPRIRDRLLVNDGGRVLFVALTSPSEELEKRIESSSRAEFGKLRSLQLFQELNETGAFVYPELPDSGLSINTTQMSAAEAATNIRDFFFLQP